MAARQNLQSEKADVNNEVAYWLVAITELVSSSLRFATSLRTLLGCCMVKPHG